MNEGFDIRKAVHGDAEAILDICVRTADAGHDGRSLYSDHRYPGLIWALPYLTFNPETALVLTRLGKVVGYAVGAVDTASFEAELERAWWPELRRQFTDKMPSAPGDGYVLDYIRRPEISPSEIVSHYPAHLHINLLPEAQGKRLGTTLLEELLISLKIAGAHGVHLGINHMNEPVADFYRKLGFNEIARLPSIVMTKSI
ncbi:GNAT family N-acetyltransferase [Rhizobium sp. S152]|uniref:GNAT family N-acetyltransferase n=1 Tax=Rhizobium sp. S152 TaxID=3055038 RepID=UPI0025A94A91|nr:GNAT family N-acetyltransferase [Rhizobium sp. S152]MDM9625041.1 GNAT family N-acetyltransferase [Rhizobium sp. S152]